VAELTADNPFPPGDYPLVVVGSGPGGLQLSYALRRLGVEHAVLSADEGPGGMFRKWPILQRMLSWTKPYAPADRRSLQYERYDWNSLLPGDGDDHLRGLQADHMDGASHFPARADMQAGLEAFAEAAAIRVSYGCRWESTAIEAGPGGDVVVLRTSGGEYRAPVVVFAVGVAEPWRPGTPGIEDVPHYGEMKPVEAYAGKDVFIVGKKNSGFEIANGLLHHARQVVLASPSPARTFAETHNLVGVRARYVQPFEDNLLGGGVFIVNGTIDSISRRGDGHRVNVSYSDGSGGHAFDADDVIAATGFQAPLKDLPALGVMTAGQSAVPVQTPFWEATVPGIYFAGTISQGAQGMRRNGVPSNSGAVHGARYNAQVLARHIAEVHFGHVPDQPVRSQEEVYGRVLDELSGAPGYGAALFHQRSYLARVFEVEPGGGMRDTGIQPLQHFVDGGGPDGIGATLETGADGRLYPAVWVRRRGSCKDPVTLNPSPLFDFRDQGSQLAAQVGATLES
jgi:thioredoxin reductase